ncbi:hypothetical protein [Brevibacillus choshinensis]|uniref:Uncharacterized protein n=1 Tax=Brevibacillus choshinensis TaxID=54911 RepID=A0ABX7FUJ6_BRECH|nr:hypothetical protein [Brevibacillus choshinensis]QRG69234.1 hypothetical protein JNE38_08920 [Brevibacillus choshinensis]
MNKQKWMMMGASAVVCAALFAPGAFAKDKDDAYRTQSTLFGTSYQIQDQAVPTYGPAQFFAPPENDNNEK